MANTLGLYDPLFYAQEAILELQKALGMASAVHRGYEPKPTQKGSTIEINVPSTFTATDMPVTATDIAPSKVELVVDQWKGVSFALTDKELAFTKEKIIEDHIRPAAYAVADAIDQSLVALYKDVPWLVNANTTIGEAARDFPDIIEVMFGNKVPKDQRSLMVAGAREAAYLKEQLFVQANTSSDSGQTQREGFLGRKFGFDIFSNQNVATHSGTAVTTAGTVAAAGAQTRSAFGVAQTLTIDATTTLTGTVEKGAVISFAGVTQKFAVTASAVASGNAVTVTVTPQIPEGVTIADNTVATITQPVSKVQNLAFHRGAFALGMAPLSELGNNLGARIATISDPVTGLALRSRMWYDGDNAKVKVGIDALWGVKTLDPNKAVRLIHT